jgi:hypothetical protein
MADRIYVFTGVATVTVTARVEARNKTEARKMLGGGQQGAAGVEWTVDEVDGDVSEIEFSMVEEL